MLYNSDTESPYYNELERNVLNFSRRNRKGKHLLGYRGVDKRIILKLILKEDYKRVWNNFV
jgi:hypothetical protein